jgi:HlyD family secretion protein
MNDPVAPVNPQVRVPPQVVPFPVSQPAAPPSPHRPSRVRLIGAIGLLLLIAVAGVAWWASRSGSTIHYTTSAVTRGAVTDTVTATGTVNPILTIIVGTYVSGVIQQLTCDYNTQVVRGQSCAKIDPRPYQTVVDQDKANLAMARAQLAKDQANLVYAKLNYDRVSRLAKSNAGPQDAADNAQSVYDGARAQVDIDQAAIEQHQAALAAAQVNLDYTDITSPVDGTVVSRNVTMGQTVAASFQTPTLFLIATDLTKMQVDTNVSESDIGGIKEGNKANFTVDAFPKRVFAGSVTQVRQSPQTVQNVVTYDVVVSVANTDLALKPGMTADTQLIVDQRTDVIRVPDQALRYTPGGIASATAAQPDGTLPNHNEPGTVEGNQAHVWILRDGKPASVPVVLGLDDDSFTEIVSGDVKPGDRIIVGEQSEAGGARSTLPTPRL